MSIYLCTIVTAAALAVDSCSESKRHCRTIFSFRHETREACAFYAISLIFYRCTRILTESTLHFSFHLNSSMRSFDDGQ